MVKNVIVRVTDEKQGFLSEFGTLSAKKVEDRVVGTTYLVESPSGDEVVLKPNQVVEV
jgi:hypothetical protein